MSKNYGSHSERSIEAQTGAVVRLGHAVGVTTPVNRFIYASLLLMEQQARG